MKPSSVLKWGNNLLNPNVNKIIYTELLKYKFLVHTWDSKSTETDSEDQKGNGNTFCVRVSHHQQEGGLHSKTWNIQVNTSKKLTQEGKKRSTTSFSVLTISEPLLYSSASYLLLEMKRVYFHAKERLTQPLSCVEILISSQYWQLLHFKDSKWESLGKMCQTMMLL